MSRARDIADLSSVSARLDTLGGAEGALSNRNVVRNGEFAVSQRGTSFTNIGSSGTYDDTWTMDRFLISQGVSAGRCSVEQSSDTPDGFSKSLKISTTTADTSIAAGEYHRLQTKFEGQDLQRFAKGTSGAKEFTLSFYCKANAAATYVVELYDNDNTRSVSKLFNVTTDWTRVTVTFPADTTGAFDNDNNLSMELNWWMHAGSTYGGGTLQTTWGASVAANRAAGIDSIFDSTSRTFFITGVQFEVGDTATDFEHRSYADELARCQRYYFQEDTTSANASGRLGVANSTTSVTFDHTLPVQMRANPSVSLTSANLRIGDTVSQGFTTTSGTVTISSYSGSAGAVYNLNQFSGLTSYRTYLHEPDSTSTGIVVFNAEL